MPTLDRQLLASCEYLTTKIDSIETIANLCKTYFTGLVDRNSILHWLLQFRHPDHVDIAYRLLNSIHFIDEPRLIELLKKATVDTLPESVRDDALFSTLGQFHDSGGHIFYSYAKALGMKEDQLVKRCVAPTDVGLVPCKPIVFIDDNITSGIQLSRVLQEFNPEHTGDREHFEKPLSPEQFATLKSVPIYILVCVELGNGKEEVLKHSRDAGLHLTIGSGLIDTEYRLEYGGRLWESPEKAIIAKSLVSSISRQLFQDKKWDDDKLSDRLLGYGNLQKLTVFSHNIPKSLLPIFWKYGIVNGLPWVPLFPEREEWRIHEAEIRTGLPERHVLAQMLCSGTFGKPTAICSAFLSDDEGNAGSGCTIHVGDDDIASEIVSIATKGKMPLGCLASPRTSLPGRYGSLGSGALSRFSEPSGKQIETYNSAVASYNARLEEYKTATSSIVREGLRLFPLYVRIYNRGTAPATEVILLVELPEGISFLHCIPELPEPPDAPKKPSGMDQIFIPPITFARPDLEYLRDIRDTIGTVGAQRHGIPQIVKEKGQQYVRLFLGKIVHGTWRDVEVSYFLAQKTGTTKMKYQLVYEEAITSVEGYFELDIRESKTASPFVLETWFPEKNNEEDD